MAQEELCVSCGQEAHKIAEYIQDPLKEDALSDELIETSPTHLPMAEMRRPDR